MARKYEVIDNCPVPEVLFGPLTRIKQKTGVVYNSLYRGSDAEGLLRRLGKMSQRQLYDGFRRGLPGFNPANPPFHSTHECYSDGVAYAVPSGVRLPSWCCGIDSQWSEGVTKAAAQEGWTATLTYPGNPREGHHVNFRKKPHFVIFRPLKRGKRGPRVAKVVRSLKYLGFYRGRVTGHFGAKVERALIEFQRAYHQSPDGIYGTQSARQLGVANRAKKKCRRKAKKETKRGTRARKVRLNKCNKRYGPERDD